jgi:hypothetical protein
MSTEVEIVGQQQPVEIVFEWKTGQALDNISKALTQIQTSVSGAWHQPPSNIDATELAGALRAALTDTLQNILEQTGRAEASNNAGDTTHTEITRIRIDISEVERAILNAANQTSTARRWNHSVVRTAGPPEESLLDRAGVRGYELINVIYDADSQQWVSFFKKLVI